MSNFNEAKAVFKRYGVDVEKALEELASIPVSLHCWQGDDVTGFDPTDLLPAVYRLRAIIPGERVLPKNLWRTSTR